MAVSVPALVLQELVESTDAGYYNRNQSILLDRKAMPFSELCMSKRKKVDMSQGIIRVGLRVSDEGENEGWTNLDPLGFSENQPTKHFEFGVYNEHRGLLIVDDYMMNNGFEVEFNSQSKTLASPLSTSEKSKLRNLITEKVDNFRDAAQVSYDRILHLDGTTDTKRTIGLDAWLPLTLTGSYGSILRSDPKIQHHIATGLTYSAGGTLEEGMNTAFWNAKLNSRGSKRGKYRLICGRGFADRYRRFARNNNAQINLTNTQTTSLDLNIADSGLRYMGHALEIDPTFNDLDTLYAPAIPWDLRCYIIHESSVCLGLFNKSDWSMSVAAPKAEERAIRCSLDWRQSAFHTNPSDSAVVSVAA